MNSGQDSTWHGLNNYLPTIYSGGTYKMYHFICQVWNFTTLKSHHNILLCTAEPGRIKFLSSSSCSSTWGIMHGHLQWSHHPCVLVSRGTKYTRCLRSKAIKQRRHVMWPGLVQSFLATGTLGRLCLQCLRDTSFLLEPNDSGGWAPERNGTVEGGWENSDSLLWMEAVEAWQSLPTPFSY